MPLPTSDESLPPEAVLRGPRDLPVQRRLRSGYSRTRMATWVLCADGLGIAVTVWVGSLLAPASTAWSWWLCSLLAPVWCYMLGGYSYPSRSRRRLLIAAGIAGLIATVVGTWWSKRPDLGLVWFGGVALWPMLVRVVLGRRLVHAAHAERWLAIGPRQDLEAFRRDHDLGHVRGDLHLIASDGRPEGDGAYIADVTDIDAVLEQDWTGVVMVGAEGAVDDRILALLLRARISGLRVYHVADFSELHTGRVPVDHLRDGWIALAQGFDLLHDPLSLRLKRLSDLITSAGLLVVGAPVMILAAIAVKITSRGPVFFTQARVGINGTTFIAYKFRSMRVGSEKGDRYTQVGDKRITPIGGFLRKTRIDELPQLFNVFTGDMSLIGPRAEWDVLVREYEQKIPYYRLRHLVRPGLTGWAQVNYPYGASVEDARRKLEYDLYYIKRFSLFLDLRILLRTVRVVLFGQGR